MTISILHQVMQMKSIKILEDMNKTSKTSTGQGLSMCNNSRQVSTRDGDC